MAMSTARQAHHELHLDLIKQRRCRNTVPASFQRALGIQMPCMQPCTAIQLPGTVVLMRFHDGSGRKDGKVLARHSKAGVANGVP